MVADQALPVRGVRARAAPTGLTPEARRWSETCCTAAAGRGHLSLLQWLRAEGCAWDAQTCSRAAFGGHLEVLIWARQNGCEWTAGTVAKAALGGALECLQVRVLGRVGRAVSARRHVGGNAMSADMSAANSGPRRADLRVGRARRGPRRVADGVGGQPCSRRRPPARGGRQRPGVEPGLTSPPLSTPGRSGPARTGPRGVPRRAATRSRAGPSRSCSGCGPTAARGTPRRAVSPRPEARPARPPPR